MQTTGLHKLIELINLTESTYILRIEKKDMEFEAGQHILLGKADDNDQREYSIYSGTNDEYLEVLIKEVVDGSVSIHLKNLNPGDLLKVEGPLGFFGLSKDKIESGKFLFIASGTGIAPFHSMIKSNPNLNYNILHGIRTCNEAYGKEDYNSDRYIRCTSRDNGCDFEGRVTDYIQQNNFDSDTICYFCGNFKMIKEAMDLLESKGIPGSQLHAEVYF
ncbi:MAG: FAD-binding oxidoreductase [Bacteroidales bacterium]|jgi:ferredoxin/flavodoxin---NADP+ reductase|nr:oxidoreductase [Lentimicrobiaceae bacterium]MDG1135446.1 FAD-binding oxidoreductase [Bacteroidales bacterium]MDG1901184.1 FAD-binding oxidoreductase [Bacteroidales bacterium]MDG2080316.1 FAD-binding oxidoreductase [Bacteroidales bacterium]|tara:strand:+ start:5311 stop:5964 length:654 start_codon:yes stop_codon:yes gene_type:complete